MTCKTCQAALDSRATFCASCGAAVPDPFLDVVLAGRYLVERRIAIGGFGSIYRAVHLEDDRKVALKIMHRELATDDKLVARFRREGEVLCKLRDPHTVATFELGETPDGLPFIAMELLDGDTLLRLLQLHGRMPWQRVFRIARAMCTSLGEAHGLGVVHRDLKPANIMLTDNETVKILDFGIAKIVSGSELGNPQELTIMGTTIGTMEYMAPEQLMGGKADGRSDIYTLGVLAYELITGRRPFNAAGLDLLTAQLTEPPPSPSQLVADLPADVDDLILRCLAADSSDRFANVDELSRAIGGVLAAHASASPLPPPSRTIPSPEVTEPMRRVVSAPIVWVAFVVLVVAGGAALAFALLR